MKNLVSPYNKNDELVELKLKVSLLEEHLLDIEKEKLYLEDELKKYKVHYLAAISQRETLQQQLNECRQAYNSLQNAFFWKITKPMRMVCEYIEKMILKVKFLRLLIRGMQNLRKEGIKSTWKKVLLKFSTKKRMEEIIRQFHLTEKEREEQEKTVFPIKIKFSILVPLYNTPENFLKEMLESVCAQTYKNWELCLADGSDLKHSNVEKICKKYASKDTRIKYQKIQKNLGISENTNVCIDMAEGDYIALFDHDDLLHPSVLYENMKVIVKERADFIYTDEATFEKTINNIITAHFKPDYGLDTLRGNNYICHFSVFSKKLLEKAGRFRKEFDGSQDHDLILRLTEQAEKIVHIQKILYYWRSHPASVAADINSKTYAIEAGKKAVLESIHRSGMEAVVESSKAFPTIYRIKYKLKKLPLVSIIIPNKNHEKDIKRCITSILELSTYNNYEILIVDNGTTDKKTLEYYDYIKENKQVRLLHWDKDFNYSAINNYAVSFANGEILILLNSDTKIITSQWIEEMLMYIQRDDVGAVGAKLYYEDNTIQHAGVVIGLGADRVAGHIHYKQPKENLGYMGRLYYAQNLSAVTAACMMIKKSLYIELHGLDENFKVAFNDIDLCMRIREKEYLIVFTPYAELYHYESKTRGLEDSKEKQERFQKEVLLFHKKWNDFIQKGDSYYNPNFSLDRDDFTIK